LKSDVTRSRSGSWLQPYLGARSLAGALCALILLLGTAWPIFAEDEKQLTAILIVARSGMADPYFADSVVLVMNNLIPHAHVGIIVNRPTPITVSQLASELFPNVKNLAKLQGKVYFGGPVEVRTVWFLFRAPKPPEHAVQAFDGVCLSADKQLLQQLLGRDKPMDGLRIFVGHAGWAPGQLQEEIADGAWAAKRADADAIFNGKSEHPFPPPQPPPAGPKGST
jgi:putative transcriptional regulator